MKLNSRINSLLLIFFLMMGSAKLYSQVVLYEGFEYATPAYIGGNGAAGTTSNNWTTHSVTAGQTTTEDIADGSLVYSGLATSAGNKVYHFSNANATSRDINRAFTSSATVLYFSALISIVDNSQITATGDYFLHFGATAGASVTVFGARTGVKTSGTGFRFVIQNTSGGTPTFTDNGTDLAYGNTYLVVVKYDRSASPTMATLWVNPVSLGGTEPATGSVSNNSGTSTFASFGSICLRNNATTPKAYVDEIRVGGTWADVTPTGAAVASISVLSPGVGEQWRQGSTHNITWSSSNINTNVKIEYTANASAGTPTWTTLAASVPAASGSWSWAIPAAQALSTDSKIRITDIPQTAVGLSGTFSIVPPPTDVSTLAALRAGTPGVSYRYTGQGVLTFKQTFRNQKYIQDATAAILIDDVSGKITTNYNLGDAITNIIGTVADFGNMTQFTPESDPGAAASTGNTVTPQVVTITQLTNNWEDYESELVKLANVSFTAPTGNFANGTVYPIADNASNPFNFRTTFYDVDYIGTAMPVTGLDMVVIPNSRTEGNFVTSRSLADFTFNLPTITVTYPNGGQFFQQGTPVTITWVSNNFSANVKIELVGANPSVIVASTANSGTYTWNIPANQAIASDYKIKISDAADGDPSDQSNNTFSVVAPYTIPNLVITEIMYNSPGNDEEWIEIFNNTSSAVDMGGYYILDDDPTHIANPVMLPAGATVQPQGRYTVELATAGAFPFVPNFDGSGKFSLGNTTDEVKLYHKYGTLIDSVKYMDSSPWPTAPDGGGPSLTFCDPTQDNSVATFWSASTEPYTTLQGGTIKATPGTACYLSSDNIMITEIMYNPIDGGNDSLEYIEVYNKGGAAVNVKDWYFSSGIAYTFSDVSIAAGGYYVIAREPMSMYLTFGISCPAWTSGYLDDAGEAIVLKDAIGQVKDSVFYLPTAPWPTAPDNGGPSLTFCNPALDNSIPENWSASTNQAAVNGIGQPIYGTPGGACQSGAQLVISEIMYNPPESGTDSLEFVEIYNNGPTIDLQGFSFGQGVVYTFPSYSLAAGDRVLVAGNSSAIQHTFGKPSLQWTSGGLNNTGETISILDNFGMLVDEVTYANAAPWDTLAAGHGPSLSLCDVTSDNSLPINWTASTEVAGVNGAGVTIYASPLTGCVNPPTVANFSAFPTEILENQTVQFTDLSTNNPTSWQWSFPGGTPSASTEQNPMVQYQVHGGYSVTLTATNAYGSSSMTKTTYIIVGVEGLAYQGASISIFPNPATTSIHVVNPVASGQMVEVFTMMGQLVYKGTFEGSDAKVNISNLAQGLYQVRVTDMHNSSVFFSRFVKQ